MRVAKLTVAIVLGLTLWGCSQPKENSSEDIAQLPVLELVSRDAATQPLTQAEADEIMAEFVEAVNQGNADYLLAFLSERSKFKEFAQAALEDYETYFNGEDISGFELQNIEELGEKDSPSFSLRFNYKIYSPSGISKKIAVYQDNTVRITDEFMGYSYWTKNLLAHFIEAIQAENAETLAKILNPDDLPYPENKAQEVIANYEKHFDTATLQYQFKSLEEDSNQFVYTLYGSKAGQPVEHQVKIVYGDGLVGLRDEWVPQNA